VEDFSSNAKGWSLGPLWEIGPADAGPDCATDALSGFRDPGQDHTPTIDNGVAGVVIGGCDDSGVHDFYFLVSPTIDTSSAQTLSLVFWRWLVSDSSDATIDVFDGKKWNNIYYNGNAFITDDSWNRQVVDITRYKNSAMQVRWEWRLYRPAKSNASEGSYISPSWSIDDVCVAESADVCR